MSLYEVLKASRSQRFPDYFTLLWGRKLSASMIKTLTGTLPLTFTAKAGNMLDWSISGNDSIGKNLLEITAETQTRDGITFTVDKQAGTVTLNGVTSAGFSFVVTARIDLDGTYLLSGCADGGSSTSYDLYMYDVAEQRFSGRCYDSDDVVTFNCVAGHATRIYIQCRRNYNYDNVVFKPMLRLPNTSATFEPYQVGVGEKTKNYVKVETGATEAGVTFTFDPVAGTVTANGTATRDAQCRVYFNNPGQPNNSTVPPGNYYFSGCPIGGGSSTYDCYSWDNDTNARSKQWDGTTNVETDNGQGNCQVQINGHSQSIVMRIKQGYTANNVVFKPMLRAADTGAEFIPYGYEVSLDIRHKTKNLLKDEWRQGNAQDPTTTVRCCATSVIPTVLGDTFSFGLYNATKRYAIYGINAAGLAEFNQTQTVSAVNRIYNPGFTTDNKTVTTENANIVAYWVMLAQSEGTVPATIVPDDCKNSIVIVRGTDLPSSYEPYYLSNHEDIYIGASPLTEGETVSNTKEIEVFEGENTIDTTLYNKPVMKIEYK